MPWNPDHYHQFQQERFAPFEDLLALIRRRPGLRVLDLGCGTGELTRRLADWLPESEVVGIDNSPEMLERAASQARPGLRFQLDTIERVTGTWDLLFSHAALQWVEDHAALIPRLLSLLAPGGQLAVQMPSNHRSAAHRALTELAAAPPFHEALRGWTRTSPVLSIEAYAELLHASGGQELTVLEKVYPHLLPDADAVLEWTRGTALIPYLERLPQASHEAFLATYHQRLQSLWPTGPAFFPFRRILFAATRSG
jgi:trans-aconitate 2-methyltransferase